MIFMCLINILLIEALKILMHIYFIWSHLYDSEYRSLAVCSDAVLLETCWGFQVDIHTLLARCCVSLAKWLDAWWVSCLGDMCKSNAAML